MRGSNTGFTDRTRVARETSENDFSAFDNLPPRLRQAIAGAPFKMLSTFAARMLQDGYTEDTLIQMLNDRQQELAEDGAMPKQSVRPIRRIRNARRGRLWR